MNKWIGILIIVLYFLNSQVCEVVYPNGGFEWFKLKYGILTFITYLSLEYKSENIFLEKLFKAILFQTAYIYIFENETTYSIHDVSFIAFFIAVQYLKDYYNKHFTPLKND